MAPCRLTETRPRQKQGVRLSQNDAVQREDSEAVEEMRRRLAEAEAIAKQNARRVSESFRAEHGALLATTLKGRLAELESQLADSPTVRLASTELAEQLQIERTKSRALESQLDRCRARMLQMEERAKRWTKELQLGAEVIARANSAPLPPLRLPRVELSRELSEPVESQMLRTLSIPPCKPLEISTIDEADHSEDVEEACTNMPGAAQRLCAPELRMAASMPNSSQARIDERHAPGLLRENASLPKLSREGYASRLLASRPAVPARSSLQFLG